jgi:hypothetical protein
MNNQVLVLFFLTLCNFCAAQTADFTEFTAGPNKVKIYLQPDEVTDQFDASFAENYFKATGAAFKVITGVIICDRALHARRQIEGVLSPAEQNALVRLMIVTTDSGMGPADIEVIKRTIFADAKDSEVIDSQIRKALEIRSNSAPADEEFIKLARQKAGTPILVSQTKRHLTFSTVGEGLNVTVSYIIVESKMAVTVIWSSGGQVANAIRRMAGVVDLIESQTREWDGSVRDLSRARFSGFNGVFSFSRFGKWDLDKAPGAEKLFSPQAQSLFMKYSEQTKAGTTPLLAFVLETTQHTSPNAFWKSMLDGMSHQVANGTLTIVADARPYPTKSGWPAVLSEYRLNQANPIRCRIVIMKIGPNKFLATYLFVDVSADDQVLETWLECVDSIDTPDSPKARAIR